MTKRELSEETRRYLAEVGAEGGRKARGDAKRRSPEHYQAGLHKRWKLDRLRRELVKAMQKRAELLPQRATKLAEYDSVLAQIDQLMAAINEAESRKW